MPAPGLRVLIIEDNPDVADMLADLIGAWGCETRVANTAQAGLNAGEEWRPEVVLLDIGLPDLHGWEVARRVRQGSWGRDALLVTITAWGRGDDQRRSTAVGIDHHLLKPVDSRALWRILTAVQPRR
jgi:CheY-like chemotaxis protein